LRDYKKQAYYMKVLPFLFYLTIFSLGFRGINISGIKVADIILILAVLLLLWQRRKLRINFPIAVMLYMLFLFVLISIFKAERFSLYVRDIFRYPLAASMFLLVTNFVDTREKIDKVVSFTVLIGAICAVINLVVFGLWSMGAAFPSLLHVGSTGGQGRVEAFFYDPNHYASFMIIPALFSVWHLLKELGTKQYKRGLWKLGFSLLILSSVIVTGSRSAVVSLAIGLTAIFAIGAVHLVKRISRKDMLLTATLIMLIICSFVASGYFIADFVSSPWSYTRLIEFKQFRAGSVERGLFKRLQLWKGCFYAFIENPLVGVGTSNFINVYPRIATKYNLGHNIGQFPHNSYLGLLAEVGLMGFVLELAILVYVFSLSFRCLSIGYDYKLSVILMSVFLSLAVNMFFLDMIYARRIWFLFGLIVSYCRISSFEYRKVYDVEPLGKFCNTDT